MDKLEKYLESEGFGIRARESDKILWKKGLIVIYLSGGQMEIFQQPTKTSLMVTTNLFTYENINQIRKSILDLKE